MSVRLQCAVEVDAAPHTVWDLLVDWPRQGEWMLLTRVEGEPGRPGARLLAVTGIGPIAVRDSLVVTGWEPPWRCIVEHTGRIIRGTGSFLVEPLPRSRSRFVLIENLELPLGRLGRLAWPLVAPVMRAGVRASLTRFARLAAAQPSGESAG